jgi:hypothetical protein
LITLTLFYPGLLLLTAIQEDLLHKHNIPSFECSVARTPESESVNPLPPRVDSSQSPAQISHLAWDILPTTASTADEFRGRGYFTLLNAYGNGMLDKTKKGITGLKHSIGPFRCCCTITASTVRWNQVRMSAESQKRTMRYSTSAFASRDDLLVVEGVFRLARMSLSASLGQSKLDAFAAPHDNPTPAPKHASLSHHNIAKPPHISKVHDVFHLLDASLAREQLDSSSASQCEEGSTLDSQPAGLPNPTHSPNSAAPAVDPTTEQIGSTIICDNFEG